MNVNNNFSIERIKKTLNLKTVLSVLIIVAVLSTVFYITLENYESKDVLIWHITDDTNNSFSEGAIKLINDYGAEKGIDKVLLTRRHPDDQYFDVAMSTSAFYNCDAFIMQKELVQEYADSGMFMSLSSNGANKEDMLYIEDKAIGLLIFEDYYFLINARSDVDLETIYGIYEILIDNYQ